MLLIMIVSDQKKLSSVADEGEKFVTLDDVERTLKSDQLVITNGREPVALAGVMGGKDSEVQTETTTVLLDRHILMDR